MTDSCELKTYNCEVKCILIKNDLKYISELIDK